MRLVENILTANTRFPSASTSGTGSDVETSTLNANGVYEGTVECLTGSLGRSWWTKTDTLTANQWYAYSFEVTGWTGTFNNGDGFSLIAGTATLDHGDWDIDGDIIQTNGTGRYSAVFMSSTGGTATPRIGVGIFSNQSNKSLTIKNIMLEEIDIDQQGHTCSEYVYPGYQAGFDYPLSTSRDPATFKVSEASIKKRSSRNKHDFVLVLGDSRNDEYTDVGDELQTLMTDSHVAWHARGGWSSSNQLADSVSGGSITGTVEVNIDLTLSGKRLIKTLSTGGDEQVFSTDYSKATTLVIANFGVNDILSVTDEATATTAIDAFIENITIICNKAKSRGMDILFTDNSPWNSHTSWTSAKGDATTRLNARIQQFASDNGYLFVSIYDALGDSSDPDELAAAYDQGDGIHLSTAGAQAVAQIIKDKLDADGRNDPKVSNTVFHGTSGSYR